MLSKVAAFRAAALGGRSCMRLEDKLVAVSVRGFSADAEEKDSMGLTQGNKTWGQGTFLDRLTKPKFGMWYLHPFWTRAREGVKVEDAPGMQYEPKVTPKIFPVDITLNQHIANWEAANDIFYGPDRDMENFPTMKMQQVPDKFNCYFIPTEVFQSIYPKLGVSGGYTLVLGFFLFMMSKEILAIGCAKNLKTLCAMMFIYYAHSKAPYLKEVVKDLRKKEEDYLFGMPMQHLKDKLMVAITESETEVWRQDAVPEIFAAKKEYVTLQLESHYRDRLAEAFREVKRKLDYLAELDSVHRKIERDHMVSWIVANVVDSITAQQEKESITNCIQTLKTLSKTASL